MELSWAHLTVSTRERRFRKSTKINKKIILYESGGVFKPRNLTVIFGPSGNEFR